jgi:hypothetical protein
MVGTEPPKDFVHWGTVRRSSGLHEPHIGLGGENARLIALATVLACIATALSPLGSFVGAFKNEGTNYAPAVSSLVEGGVDKNSTENGTFGLQIRSVQPEVQGMQVFQLKGVAWCAAVSRNSIYGHAMREEIKQLIAGVCSINSAYLGY